jgi:hypothetical protein
MGLFVVHQGPSLFQLPAHRTLDNTVVARSHDIRQDRPIFEIKRKGRPPSQCQSCRESRRATGSHSKCTCKQDKPAADEEPKPDGPNFKGFSLLFCLAKADVF